MQAWRKRMLQPVLRRGRDREPETVAQPVGHALAHPQTQALNVVREVPAANGATVRVRAFPARFSQLQPEIKGVAPALGEHTQTVAAEIRG